MTQWIALRSSQLLRSTSPSRGSQDRKRVRAGISARCGNRLSTHRWFSTVVPSHTLSGQSSSQGVSRRTRCGRLVSNSQSRHGVSSMRRQSRSRQGDRAPLPLEDIGHGRAEDSGPTTRLLGFGVPSVRLPPVGVTQEASRLANTPDLEAEPPSPGLGVAVVAGWRDLCASPPGIECVVGPLDPRITRHTPSVAASRRVSARILLKHTVSVAGCKGAHGERIGRFFASAPLFEQVCLPALARSTSVVLRSDRQPVLPC